MNIEITREAFRALNPKWKDHKHTDLAAFDYYEAHGVLLIEIHNYVSNVTQYYVQDINA